MKTRASVVLPARREEVWSALTDLNLRSRWQAGLKEASTLSGVPGERDHVCRLRFDDGRPDSFETVTEVRAPDLLATVVETNRFRRTLVHNLEDLGDGNTRWQAWSNTTAGTWTQLRAVFHRSAMADNLEEDMQRFKLMLQTDQAADGA